MKRRGSSITWLIAAAGVFAALCTSATAEIVAKSGVKQLDMQQAWHTKLPLEADETVQRAVLLDDNLYVLTSRNAAFTLHAPTGVLRWVKPVAEEGEVIRGPSHSSEFAFFTSTGSVRILQRHSGLAAGEPRHLEGVIIEVIGHSARLSIGSRHGVRRGDVLEVRRMSTGREMSDVFATVEVTSVEPLESQAKITRLSNITPASGDVVLADVVLPLSEVRLPHAASGAAVVDSDNRLYYPAANQRFFSLDLLSGFQHYQISIPQGMTITPVIYGADMFIAGHDGRVTSFDRLGYRQNWAFKTEGPIFADLAVSSDHVLIASSDRSLYCLDRKSGKRLWRERFDKPLMQTPVLDNDRVYLSVEDLGLVVLDAKDGKRIWKREDDAHFLARVGEQVYLISNGDYPSLYRVDANTGKTKAEAVCQSMVMSEGSTADQAVYLVTPLGEVACLRHKNAPKLTREMLAAALRNNQLLKERARMLVKQQAEAKKKAAAVSLADQAAARRKSLEWLFSDDWLTSRSSVKPVGGRDLVKPAGEEEEAIADDVDEDTDEDVGEDDDWGDDDWGDDDWGDDDWDDEESDDGSDDEEAEEDDVWGE